MPVKDAPEHPVTASSSVGPCRDLDYLLGVVIFYGAVARQLDQVVSQDTPSPVDMVGFLHLPQLLRRLVSVQHLDHGTAVVVSGFCNGTLADKSGGLEFLGSYDKDRACRNSIVRGGGG